MNNISYDTTKSYTYDAAGRLSGYNGEGIAYDGLGNPTSYRNKSVEWSRGRLMTKFNGHTFGYDGTGRRVSKDGIRYTYDMEGKLFSSSDGLQYYHDETGVFAVKYNKATYFYRKDVQGNIIGLIDSDGRRVVEYVYDAWGNHAVLDSNGNDLTDASHIGNRNPFRYRGYFYDAETGLYYLQTRYYDPETGRFLNMDDLSYADPQTIHGLNLYAYCGNNPVMYIDPTGTFFFTTLLIGLIAGAVIGGAVNGVIAYNNGARGWDLVGQIALGAVVGGVIGAAAGAVVGAGGAIMGMGANLLGMGLNGGGLALANGMVLGAGTVALAGAAGAVVGGAIVVGGITVALEGLNVLFSKNATRYGKSKLGSNHRYNKQFDAFWREYGNGNLDKRRAFHDFISKKGQDAWEDLLKAWEEFIKRRYR